MKTIIKVISVPTILVGLSVSNSFASYEAVKKYESELFDKIKSTIEDGHSVAKMKYITDKNHITFVNGTNQTVRYEMVATKKTNKQKAAVNNDKTFVILKPKTSNYINVGADRCRKDGKDNGKRNWITIKAIDKSGGNPALKFQRKCGQDVYMWGFKDTTLAYGPTKYSVRHDLSGTDDAFNSNNEKQAILFVHGYTSSQNDWKTWKEYAKENGWRVFGTSVSGFGSIMKRGQMLANYINVISDLYDIPDNTIVAVGHSMGGLDLRYLVGNGNRYKRDFIDKDKCKKEGKDCYNTLQKAAKKLKRVYTLSTPHKGSKLAKKSDATWNHNRNMPYGKEQFADDASYNLRPAFLEKFNKIYPYKSFKNFYLNVGLTPIPFLAVRFACRHSSVSDKPQHGDSAVAVTSQSLSKAPMTTDIYWARHDYKIPVNDSWCDKTDLAIQDTTSFLKDILEDAEEIKPLSSKIAN